MIVVSDTSPIIGLASIETLDVLRALYDRVLIPEAVYHELTTGDDLPGSSEVQRSDWIEDASSKTIGWSTHYECGLTRAKPRP